MSAAEDKLLAENMLLAENILPRNYCFTCGASFESDGELNDHIAEEIKELDRCPGEGCSVCGPPETWEEKYGQNSTSCLRHEAILFDKTRNARIDKRTAADVALATGPGITALIAAPTGPAVALAAAEIICIRGMRADTAALNRLRAAKDEVDLLSNAAEAVFALHPESITAAIVVHAALEAAAEAHTALSTATAAVERARAQHMHSLTQKMNQSFLKPNL
ncbi:MAG: hypothetical protein Harvfovirus19_25 [Harvfovirus sp.]|uniref:C2H2-type domain-containing protein n=1 Tax=Harvfovirus sp. TaxID=2487768 RepID=A0A3G5A225_9VIRU|nr:MAG: hypothetical protein Harvfovirus19_25 [Harvfovirus sp.]